MGFGIWGLGFGDSGLVGGCGVFALGYPGLGLLGWGFRGWGLRGMGFWGIGFSRLGYKGIGSLRKMLLGLGYRSEV